MMPRLIQVAIALITAGVLAGAATAYRSEQPFRDEPRETVAVRPSTAAAPSVFPDFGAIVERNAPAVVNISAEARPGSAGPDPNALPFDRPHRRGRPLGGAPAHAQGSGFIVSPDGIILTNEHVVHGATAVTVRLTDRREFRARVLGVDPSTDVAVIKVDATSLPTVVLGDPSKVRPGDWVIAIGSPFGLESSVTAGIVSANGRSLPGESYVPFIQTDVAVNPGNSGGPLINLAGEVIGMNAQIYSDTGAYEGISFAIPIDVARRVEREILATGHATHARLGVIVQDVDQAIADSFGLEQSGGALISRVEPGGPAAKAGLEPGDIVLAYDGHPVAGSGDLPLLVDKTGPGDRAAVEIWRRGARRAATATPAAAKAFIPAAPPGGIPATPGGKLGLTGRVLTLTERRETGVANGVFVEHVEEPAARAGIEPGDIVLALNDTPVKHVDELRPPAGKSPGSVALLVQRGDSRLYVALDLR